MSKAFHIPRQTDREIVAALSRIKGIVPDQYKFQLLASVPSRGNVVLADREPEQTEEFRYVFDLNSAVLENAYLRGPGPHTVLMVRRELDKVYDTVTVEDQWVGNIEEPHRSQLMVAILAHARTELKAADFDASLKGQEDNAWNRYRDAQTTVINSLQQTSEAILVKVAERNNQLDKDRDKKFADLEKKLRDDLAQEKAAHEKQIADQRANLGQREKALTDREAAFETKESRYVARQKQGEQVKQIQEWLKDWHLTEGTRKKRTPIFWTYVLALVLTGLLTAYTVFHSYDLLRSSDDISKLQWWHWVALTLKPLFPLAVFTTFMIYFIRWAGDWARQHANEEFRNRTLLIDIGRSSWLLEAVRDAHERNKEIPSDLLKELSRNLFAANQAADSDVHPQAATDLLLQGLSSIRVKSPEGAEVEAKRGK